jgi:hypothetical protein
MPPTSRFTGPKTVFLHIGIHKTGTSAIQNVCIENHRELLQAGILFPKAGFTRKGGLHATATSGHSGLIGFLNAPNAPDVPPPGQALLRRIESGSWNRLVLSSELLSQPDNRGAVECIAWFRQRGFEVKLIAYLRRQDRWLDSFYRERLEWKPPKYRDARSIDEFWRAEGDAWLNYEERIGHWVAAVGRDHAQIRSYEDVQNAGGVVGDFLAIIGAEPAQLNLAQSVGLHNPSLPAAAADLMRAVNTFPSSVIPRKGQLVAAISKTSLFTRTSGSLIGPALWEEIKAAYGEQNEELRARWLSGPSAMFSFREGPGPRPLVEQAVSFADGVILLEGLLKATTLPAAPAASSESGHDREGEKRD